MTLKQFATQHGVGLSTLSKWLRAESTAPPPPVKFKEMVLPTTSLRYAVELVSPHGWIVRLPNGSDVQMLPKLLQALPC